MKRVCHMSVLWILIDEKQFPKFITWSEFDYGLSTKLTTKIVAPNFPKFIQIQKRYSTAIDKRSILIWRPFAISTQNISCELNSLRKYSLQNISYMSLRL